MPAWLENRVGPYAVWQWLAILAAGIALALAVRRFRPASGSSRPATTGGDPTQLGPFAGTQATGGPGVTYTVDASASTRRSADAPTTNREWLALASSRVAEQGMHSAVATDTALRRYLSGRALDGVQVRIVDTALSLVGPPPEGAPPIEREEPIPHNGGPTDSGSLRTIDGQPYERHTVTTIDGQAVRVSPSDDGTSQVRDLTWYGSAGGAPGIIDTDADWRRVESARGVGREDTGTAVLIIEGSFGPVADHMRRRIQRVANRHVPGQ